MDHFDFYKELYHKENDRRQEVTNSLNIPLAIVTALATGIYILVTTFPFNSNVWVSYSFSGLVIATTTLLLVSVYHLIRAFIDIWSTFEYKGLPFAKSLFDWHVNLDAYYRQYYSDPNNVLPANLTVNEVIENEFKSYVMNQFIESIDHNTYINDKKHSHIFNSKRYLVWCLSISFITLIPYLIGFFLKEDPIQKVQVVVSGPPKVDKSTSHKPNTHAKPETTVQPQPAVTNPKSPTISNSTNATVTTARAANKGGKRTSEKKISN